MFPDLEFIKTMLNGLRSRIEKVEKSISQALASIKAQLTEAIKSSTADWNQNDPNALDYVKNRTHWDDESQTQTIDYNAWKGERPSIPLILGVWYEVSWSSAMTAHAYVQYMNTDEADGRFECKQNSAGELYVGFDSGSPFCIFSDRTEINTSWLQVNRVDGLRLTGEITPGLHQLDKKYIPRDVLNEIHTLGKSVENQNLALSKKMNAANPTGTGAFSLNRKANSTVGDWSFSAGSGTIASGKCSFSAGFNTTASGEASFAAGHKATASGDYSFAAGYEAEALGAYSFAAGQFTTAFGDYSFVTGRNNLIDNSSRYLHIVGNGFGASNSNAYTLDRSGNGWFAGDVFVGGTRQNEGVKLLKAGEAIPIPQTASVGQVLAVKAVDENGKPTEWEPVTLPEQVQADWNQNDSTAADYVKNRPFYLKDARETRIFERVFTVQTGLSYENFDGTNLGLEAGKEYTVNIMGHEFKATAYVYEDGVVCIGDGDAAYNGNTNFIGDVPFGVVDVAGAEYAIVLSAPYLVESGLVSEPTDEIPVNIISEIQEVVPIDSKFLPTATQISAGVISKNQVRNEIFVNELLNVFENKTTYKQLREYLGHRVFSVVHYLDSSISSDGVSLFVTNYQTSIGAKGFVRVNGYPISGGNINGIRFVFPLNSDGSGIDDDALLESISLIIPNYILLENNDKKFKITVDDSGTISSTEVV